ncbi:MAG: hypothetical protein IIV78_00535 [Oscillospiraceae bacterium]|nr:hypothetical protein [Oscillospiraceae bacterium]
MKKKTERMPLTGSGAGEEILSFQEEFPLRWGTYEVQRTNDTDNLFPMIAQGLPKAWEGMRVGKEEVEKM